MKKIRCLVEILLILAFLCILLEGLRPGLFSGICLGLMMVFGIWLLVIPAVTLVILFLRW